MNVLISVKWQACHFTEIIMYQHEPRWANPLILKNLPWQTMLSRLGMNGCACLSVITLYQLLNSCSVGWNIGRWRVSWGLWKDARLNNGNAWGKLVINSSIVERIRFGYELGTFRMRSGSHLIPGPRKKYSWAVNRLTWTPIKSPFKLHSLHNSAILASGATPPTNDGCVYNTNMILCRGTDNRLRP